jgi:hypothetical protein
LQLHRAHCGLHHRRRLPAVAATGPALVGAPLVAGAAQELVDLGLQGGLQQQPHAPAGDVLQDRGQLTLRGEQLVDLGAQALGERYSSSLRQWPDRPKPREGQRIDARRYLLCGLLIRRRCASRLIARPPGPASPVGPNFGGGHRTGLLGEPVEQLGAEWSVAGSAGRR